MLVRRRVIGVACILAVAFGGFAVTRARTYRPADVEVVEVRRGAITASFTADAVVKGKTVDLAPQAAGRVRALHVVEGQAVPAGQPLVELDAQESLAGAREAEAAVRTAETLLAQAEAGLALTRDQTAARRAQAEAELAAARAHRDRVLRGARAQEIAQAQQQVEIAHATLVAAEQALRRARELHAAGGLARADLETAEAHHQVARAEHAATLEALDLLKAGARPEERAAAHAQVAAAEANLAAAQAGYREVELRQADVTAARARVIQARAGADRAAAIVAGATVSAPFDGVVSRVWVEVGHMASPLSPLVTLIVLGDLWITADIADEDAAKVRLAQPVIVTAPAYPGRRFRGRVVELAPQAEVKADAAIRTRIVRVKIRLLEAAQLLRPGLEVDVEGTSTVVTAALVIPSDAVVLHDNRAAAFVVDAGLARLRAIRVGYASVDLTEVLSGLREGELVVTTGADALTDGRSVRIRQRDGD
jgi:HlyD family secretion protein